MLQRDEWRCQTCGSRVGLEVHHVTPRSQLGHDAEENLITLCWDATGRSIQDDKGDTPQVLIDGIGFGLGLILANGCLSLLETHL